METTEKEQVRNITWENNHQKIMKVINEAMKTDNPSMPGITDIATVTGLSRQTIYEHIKDCSTHSVYKEHKEIFGLMQYEVMMKLCTSAINGDIRAMRLFLEVTGMIKSAERNNNLQINGLMLNQHILQNLNDSQLKEIEEIIRPAAGNEEKVNKG